jgi:hypothetical protein
MHGCEIYLILRIYDRVKGRWRKLYNEQFDTLYSSPNIVIKEEHLLFENISTGLPPHGQPLNCNAGPIINTATTWPQSAFVSFWGLSITRYGMVRAPFWRRSRTSFSLFASLTFLLFRTHKPA